MRPSDRAPVALVSSRRFLGREIAAIIRGAGARVTGEIVLKLDNVIFGPSLDHWRTGAREAERYGNALLPTRVCASAASC